MPVDAGSRIAATVYHGKDYVYIGGTTSVYRFIWDGKNINLDKSWSTGTLTKSGQTSPVAPVVAGDWVFTQTNNQPPSNVTITVIAISQANASKVSKIDPMPLPPGRQSYIPANPPIDLENNMVYGMDGGAGKLVGIKFNPVTGNMSLAWSANETTVGWFGLIGPANKRVVVASNIHPNTPFSALKNNPPPNYKEQIQWRDAATGKLLAASDYFSPMSPGFEVWPGYGGVIYEGLNDGHIMALKVLPQPSNATSTAGATG
jgi:hypothetical protein